LHIATLIARHQTSDLRAMRQSGAVCQTAVHSLVLIVSEERVGQVSTGQTALDIWSDIFPGQVMRKTTLTASS